MAKNFTQTTTAPMSNIGGASPEVDESDLEPTNRVVTSTGMAVQMTQSDIQDAWKLIKSARRITAKKQGAPPYDPAKLKSQGKMWKRNFSTHFLQKELNRAAPRFYMPILNASTMTAAELPAGWPKGQEKTAFFRDTMTRAIRGWSKNDSFWRGLATEVCDYGFGFAAWTDPFEWRPKLVRMDRGFVPRGTEVMDDKVGRFTLKWDYRPDELLGIARKAVDSGSTYWNKEAVALAVQQANLPALPQDMSQLRKWEELIREQSWDYNYTRSQKVIETRHFYVLEFSGKISHYILWPDGESKHQLLYEHLDEYEGIYGTDEFVIPVTFGFGDGTIHGSWGVGQLLYDLAAQVEKIRCDSIDNLLNSNKARLQVPNAKDAASAQLVVNDSFVIATGAQFAQNVGGIAANPEGYLVLDKQMTQWAQEMVGSYLPPIPDKKTDVTAAQVNAAVVAEQEVQRDNQESWLKYCGRIVATISRRMLNPESDDDYGQAVRNKLLGKTDKWFEKMFRGAKALLEKAGAGKLADMIPSAPIALTEAEIEILLNQPMVQTVMEFTEFAAQQRGAFAASVQNNPLFNQAAVARFMAGGVQGASAAFVSEIVTPEGDTTSITAQARQQLQENASMLVGIDMPVVITDSHLVHLNTLKGPMAQAIQGGLIQPATLGLKHAAAHVASGLSTKTIPGDQINEWKAWLSQMQRALEAKTQEQQQAQAAQAAGQSPPVAQPPPPPVGQVAA